MKPFKFCQESNQILNEISCGAYLWQGYLYLKESANFVCELLICSGYESNIIHRKKLQNFMVYKPQCIVPVHTFIYGGTPQGELISFV